MKKLLLFSALIASSGILNAVTLPDPTVMVLPNQYDWFDGFSLKWAQIPTQPYKLQIVDANSISVTKNLVEDVDIAAVSLTEYQENEDSPNYEDAQLVVTLGMLESDLNSTYTLNIPAGAINVILSDSENVPCETVNYTFQLKGSDSVSLPEPNIEPAPGEISDLSEIRMSWTGELGSLDLLNRLSDLDENAEISSLSVTYNGKPLEGVETSFEWSSRLAATDGASGDIFVISLNEESVPFGVYVITILADYLQISDVETGTFYNEEIEFSYIVSENGNYIESISWENNSSKPIYNLNGMVLNSKDVNSLPAGVYIISGKKVVK